MLARNPATNSEAVAQVFPPLVSGVTIVLIGAALIGTGFQYWGGGAYCAQYTGGLPATPLGCAHCFASYRRHHAAIEAMIGTLSRCNIPRSGTTGHTTRESQAASST